MLTERESRGGNLTRITAKNHAGAGEPAREGKPDTLNPVDRYWVGQYLLDTWGSAVDLHPYRLRLGFRVQGLGGIGLREHAPLNIHNDHSCRVEPSEKPIAARDPAYCLGQKDVYRQFRGRANWNRFCRVKRATAI